MFTGGSQRACYEAITQSIAYWISMFNSDMSAAVIHLARQLPLDSEEREGIDRLINVYEAIFPEKGSYANMEKNLDSSIIPEKFRMDMEYKYMYVIMNIINSFLQSKLWDMAYGTLKKLSDDWRNLYLQALTLFRDYAHKEDFCQWCTVHTILPMDVLKQTRLDYGSLLVIFDEDGFQKADGNLSEFPLEDI